MHSRVKELDGLRGIAVMLVMAYHLFGKVVYFSKHPTLHFITTLTSVGWVGVDIFFTLSGFLITSILLRTRDEKNYFRNFYIRRALRIFPLYFVGVAAILLFVIPAKEPGYVETIPRVAPYLLLYLQNWIAIFQNVPMTVYLGVTWSLAIEEQFYLIWPAIVYFTNRQTLIKISIGIILLSILARISGIGFWKDFGWISNFFYYNTFTRFEELVFGGLLAIAFTFPDTRRRIRTFIKPVLVLAVGLFTFLWLSTLPGFPYREHGVILIMLAGYTIAPIFTTVLIAAFFIHPESSVIRRLFRNRFLTFSGKYSYSIYLFHVPISLIILDIFWHTHIKGWKIYLSYLVVTFISTILMSLLTWHLLEKHMSNLKKYFEYK